MQEKIDTKLKKISGSLEIIDYTQDSSMVKIGDIVCFVKSFLKDVLLVLEGLVIDVLVDSEFEVHKIRVKKDDNNNAPLEHVVLLIKYLEIKHGKEQSWEVKEKKTEPKKNLYGCSSL